MQWNFAWTRQTPNYFTEVGKIGANSLTTHSIANLLWLQRERGIQLVTNIKMIFHDFQVVLKMTFYTTNSMQA